MKDKIPVTAGVRFLKDKGVAFEGHPYKYEGPGNVAKDAAEALGVPDEQVYKTLVFLSGGKPVLAVVDAAHRVSVKKLTAISGADVSECPPKDAERFTGYMVGGISPFGTKRQMPVFIDESALALPVMFINGGARGFLVSLTPADFMKATGATVGDIKTV
ncbi:MAG TPA: aminoacyl-tRNA deacylase [Nitrospirota bacterium]